MNLSIIILNWNAASDTARCLQDIRRWVRLQPTIWVVDNASDDGRVDTIARTWPDVRLLCNETNLGYAGGNNRGLAAALAEGDGPILLLNNDAFVAEETIIRLIDTLYHTPDLAFIGPLLFDANQPDKLLAAGGRDIVRHLSSHRLDLPAGQPVPLVDYVPGTVLVGRSEVFRTIGLLDEAYFFTGEIPDLCRRAKQQGYLTAVDTQAQAFHAVDRSSELRGSLYPYYIIRNRFLFIRKFYPKSGLLYHGFWGLYSFALATKLQLQGLPVTARAIRLGLRDGLQGRFGDQNERVMAATARGRA